MSDAVTASTADLVRRGQMGDKGAFGQLVERFQAEAYGLAYYHLGHREDALDVAQQAFLAAYLHLDSLADPARFGGWLARIVANECLRWHRRRRPALSLDAPALGDLPDGRAVSPERAAEHGELHRDLNRALHGPAATTAPCPHALLRGRAALPQDRRGCGTTHHHGEGAYTGRTQASAAHPRAYV